jgi:hypothetical protein
MSGCQHESGRVIQELSATKTYCVGIVLSGFTPRVRPEFLRYWAYICMWTCSGSEAKVKANVTD